MLSYTDALQIILKGSAPLGHDFISLDEAAGQVAAADILAREYVPPFDNSAMDGFAVRSELVSNASPENPVILPVDGSTMAGDIIDNSMNITGNGAWEIMTGAPVPEGYDSVIRIEDITILETNTQDRPTRISIQAEGFSGKNIRKAGSDFTPGDRLIEKGVVLSPPHIMALAALGEDKIKITKSPTAAVMSTGKELVDEMDQALLPGQIRNCNAPYLLHSLKAFGIEAANAGTIYDEPEKFQQKLQDILSQNVTMILSSGAVSMGRFDFVPDGLRKMGAEILFHKAAIRPGKPILFARFPNGTYYFGLPGNPIAAAVGLRFFAYPLLRTLRGMAPEKAVSATLVNDFSKESPFRFFMKAHYHHQDNGQIAVNILPGQESFKIKPMLGQNCWAVIPETADHLSAGQTVDIYPLYPHGVTGDLL